MALAALILGSLPVVPLLARRRGIPTLRWAELLVTVYAALALSIGGAYV